MLSEQETRIRECYDAFLDAITDDRDLWEIALLEYYRYPLECWRPEAKTDWDISIPDCFQDLASELPRLTARKQDICPNDDYCTVQQNLELSYDWYHTGSDSDAPKRKLSPQAISLLLEYYLLVEAQDDRCGFRSHHILFAERSDTAILTEMIGHSIQTPEDQKTLAIRLDTLRKRWQLESSLDEQEVAWLWEQIEDLLRQAFCRGCGEAGWHLYEFLSETNRLADWDWSDPLELLREAAKAGSVDAQLEIGSLFFENAMGWVEESEGGYSGEDISAEEAVYWMEQALPHRIAAAPCLARLFLEGKGVETDEARAVRYLTAAIEGHDPDDTANVPFQECLEMLAECYMAGRGVAQDRQKAAQLYRQIED